MTDSRAEFRARIAGIMAVPPESVTLFAKGRVALYGILRALDIRAGDEVILPAFTCVAVPNAILYAGARPVYVDIDPLTYTMDPTAVERAITDRTRVVIAQNTFGASADFERLEQTIGSRDIQIVDDCTHGLGGAYRGQPNGTRAAASFFSTQWSKTISTGLGGFAVARDAAVAARLQVIESGARDPSAVSVAVLRSLVFAMEHGGHGALFRRGRSTYRALGRHGLVPSSSSRQELETVTMPEGFMTRMSDAQARAGTARIERLVPEVERRRAIAARYTAWLRGHARAAADEPDGMVHAYLRYPIRVADRSAFVAAAEDAGVDLGDWFLSPIHPVVEGLDRWGYQTGQAPVAEAVCREIVDLPTTPALRDVDIDRVIRFLAEQIDRIR